jgi:hypothetical protein
MRHLISGELTNYRVVRTSPEPLHFPSFTSTHRLSDGTLKSTRKDHADTNLLITRICSTGVPIVVHDETAIKIQNVLDNSSPMFRNIC